MPFKVLSSPGRYSQLLKRLTHGAVWSAVGTASARAFSLAASLSVARLIGALPFGKYSLIQATIGVFGSIAGFGITLSVTKHVAEFRNGDKDRLLRLLAMAKFMSLGVGALSTVALWIFSDPLAAKGMAEPGLAPLLRIASPILIFGAIGGAQVGVLSGFESFRAVGLLNGITGALRFCLTVGGGLWRGLEGAIEGLSVAGLLSWILGEIFVNSELKRLDLRPKWKGWHQEIPILWKFSIPAVLSGAMIWPVNWLCLAILSHQKSGLAEVALFNAANQWCGIILLVSDTLTNAVLPVMTNLYSERAVSQFRLVLKLSSIVGTGLIAVIALVMFSASRILMGAYGPGFSGGVAALSILLTSSVLWEASRVAARLNMSIGRAWLQFSGNLLASVVLLTMSYFFRSRGATGLALAFLASNGLRALVSAIYAVQFSATMGGTADGQPICEKGV